MTDVVLPSLLYFLCSVLGHFVFWCLVDFVSLSSTFSKTVIIKKRSCSGTNATWIHDRQMRGNGAKMAITTHHFQQVVLLINKSYKKAVSCSASALPLMKRKHSLSHTALNREVLCGHTHLCQAVSQCQTFEPSPCWRPMGFCLCVWSATVVERGSIGEGLPIVLGSGLTQ